MLLNQKTEKKINVLFSSKSCKIVSKKRNRQHVFSPQLSHSGSTVSGAVLHDVTASRG